MTIITARHVLLNGYMFAGTQITPLETLLQAPKSDMRQVYLWPVTLEPLKGPANTGGPDILSPGDPMKTRESIWTMVFPPMPKSVLQLPPGLKSHTLKANMKTDIYMVAQ